MKFTKIALAVAIASAAVAAQAQTANVTLYGGIRANVESASYSFPTSSSRVTSIENISSRWGLRGSESLGGGMNAMFQLEAGFNVDTGAGGGFTRESWVGVNGGFGEVKLGYGLTPFDDVLGMAHHQGANSWENRNNGVSGGAGFAKQLLFTNYTAAANCTSPAFDARYGNSVSYATPVMGGVKLRTQYAFLGESGSGSCTGWDTGVTYNAGPLALGAAYAVHRNFTSLGGAAHSDTAARVYGAFNAGVAKIDATYEVANYKLVTGSKKYKYWEIGAVAPMGAFTLGAQYSQRDNGLAAGYTGVGTLNVATGVANWTNGGGKHIAVTADYALSKRTLIRAYYSNLKNETGVKINALSAGLWHSF